VAAVGKLVANAGAKRLVGAPGVGVMPVTVPVVAPVNTVPVTGLRVALVTAVPVVPGLRAALVTAFPKTGLRFALVKNGAAPVVTPFNAGAIDGVTDVTTVAPGCPATSFMTLAKVGLTLVTHVAADAEDTSAALKLPTVTAARSVWCEADANSANRTAGRRGTILCSRLAIRLSSGLALSRHKPVWQNYAKRVDCNRAFSRIFRGCCKRATIEVKDQMELG